MLTALIGIKVEGLPRESRDDSRISLLFSFLKCCSLDNIGTLTKNGTLFLLIFFIHRIRIH